ncbi:glycosyltransferase family 4 protein [bacterium]|nr:glycosyltransferase family 4 protein [bacterium]
MKIAHIVCVFPPYRGGIGSVAFNYANVLSEAGVNITVLTPDYGKKQTKINYGFAVKYLKPFLKYGNGAFIPQLIVELKKYDIVHLHYPFFGGAESVWLAMVMKNFSNLLVHYHMDVAGLSRVAGFLSLPSRIILNSLLTGAQVITCASVDYIEQSQIKSIFRRFPDKFIEIPFGVDIKRFFPREIIAERSVYELLFVGGLDRAHYFKGLSVFIKALTLLPNDNWRLKIVGEGNRRKTYEKEIFAAGLGDKIEFLGGVSDEKLPTVYQVADIFVLPSINTNEAFGLVLLEAMACGLPVLTSSLPGVRSVFKDGIEGLLAKPGDAHDLSNKIKKLLDNKRLRESMGQAGRELVEKKYTWKLSGEKLLNLYENLLNK